MKCKNCGNIELFLRVAKTHEWDAVKRKWKRIPHNMNGGTIKCESCNSENITYSNDDCSYLSRP